VTQPPLLFTARPLLATRHPPERMACPARNTAVAGGRTCHSRLVQAAAARRSLLCACRPCSSMFSRPLLCLPGALLECHIPSASCSSLEPAAAAAARVALRSHYLGIGEVHLWVRSHEALQHLLQQGRGAGQGARTGCRQRVRQTAQMPSKQGLVQPCSSAAM
jgi:hypothetical protein